MNNLINKDVLLSALHEQYGSIPNECIASEAEIRYKQLFADIEIVKAQKTESALVSIVATFLANTAKEFNSAKTDKQKDKKHDAMFTTLQIAGKLGLKCETVHGEKGYESVRVENVRINL